MLEPRRGRRPPKAARRSAATAHHAATLRRRAGSLGAAGVAALLVLLARGRPPALPRLGCPTCHFLPLQARGLLGRARRRRRHRNRLRWRHRQQPTCRRRQRSLSDGRAAHPHAPGTRAAAPRHALGRWGTRRQRPRRMAFTSTAAAQAAMPQRAWGPTATLPGATALAFLAPVLAALLQLPPDGVGQTATQATQSPGR